MMDSTLGVFAQELPATVLAGALTVTTAAVRRPAPRPRAAQVAAIFRFMASSTFRPACS